MSVAKPAAMRVLSVVDNPNTNAQMVAQAIELEPGKYPMLRLILGDRNTVKLPDGSSHPLRVPSGMQSGLKLQIDLDAQASLTQLFGVLPHLEVDSKDTVLPFLEGPKTAGEEWSGTLAGATSNMVKAVDWSHGNTCGSNSYGAENPGGQGSYFASVINAAQAARVKKVLNGK